jgi:hypothetical protein
LKKVSPGREADLKAEARIGVRAVHRPAQAVLRVEVRVVPQPVARNEDKTAVRIGARVHFAASAPLAQAVRSVARAAVRRAHRPAADSGLGRKVAKREALPSRKTAAHRVRQAAPLRARPGPPAVLQAVGRAQLPEAALLHVAAAKEPAGSVSDPTIVAGAAQVHALAQAGGAPRGRAAALAGAPEAGAVLAATTAAAAKQRDHLATSFMHPRIGAGASTPERQAVL